MFGGLVGFHRRYFRVLWGLALLASAVSTVLFLLQGGFAGGDWPYDRIILLLGLPWCLIPLPDLVPIPAFLWFILIPLLLNLCLAALAAWILRKLLG